MKNKVSVIVGVYYPYPILFRKCLDSCLQQNMSGLEFIFLLDGPNDVESRQILSEYQEKFDKNQNSFIVVENEKNLGIYWNQMKGLDISTGEYVVFYDDDDFFDYDYLSTLYEYAKKFDANVIKGHALTHFYGNMDFNFVFLCKENNVFNNDDWCYMYKTNFFRRYFNYDTMYTSDTKKFAKINDSISSIDIIIEVPLWESTFYHYIRHNKNTSFVSFEPIEEQEIIQDDLKDKIRIRSCFFNVLKNTLPDYKHFSKGEIDTFLKNKVNFDDAYIDYTYDDIKGL